MDTAKPSSTEPPEEQAAIASAPKTKAGKSDRRHLRGMASAQRIIDTTIKLIAEDGIASVTMQRIAEHVGSSNALVVFHFGTKEKLYRAVLEYLNDQFARLWRETVLLPQSSAAERIVAAIDCARHFRLQHPDWVAVWVLFSSDRQTAQLDRLISLPFDHDYLAQTHGFLTELATTDGRGDVDIDTLSEGLNYLVQGAWYWDTFNPDRVRPEALRKSAMILLHQAFPNRFPLTDG